MDGARVLRGVEAVFRPVALRLVRLGQPRWWLVGVLSVVALAVAVRFLLYLRFPIFFTNDSVDYIRAAERIAIDLDFSSSHLRDWRLPGYPVFLALLQRLTEWTSSDLVVAQKVGGVVCAVLGLAMARSLGWRVGAVLLGAFLAFHPVYLLNEHLAMSEALFTLLLWVFSALSIAALGRPPGIVRGLLVGGAFSVCVLTRAPGLFWCAPVLLGVMLFSLTQGQGRLRTRARRLLPFVAGLLLAGAALMGPWTYRNYLLYGTLSPFTNNVQRTLVGYLSMHNVLDPDLPAVRPYARDRQANPRVESNGLILRLGPGAKGEQRAAQIVREQLRAQKWEYLRHVSYSLTNFLGLPAPFQAPGGRDVSYWFNGFVDNLASVTHRHNTLTLKRSLLRYVEIGRHGRLLEWWAAAGVAYLETGRTVLTIVFGLALVAYLLTGGFKIERRRERAAVLIFVVAFLAVAVGHALLLSSKERYVVPWDGFQVWIVVGVLEHLARAVRGGGAVPGEGPLQGNSG